MDRPFEPSLDYDPPGFPTAWLLLTVLENDYRLPPSVTSPESVRALTESVVSEPSLFKVIRPHLVPIAVFLDDIPDITDWVQNGELRAITDQDGQQLVSGHRVIELAGLDYPISIFGSWGCTGIRRPKRRDAPTGNPASGLAAAEEWFKKRGFQSFQS